MCSIAMADVWGLLLCAVILVASKLAKADGPQAIFIFGDSTMDVGTNSNLNDSSARADLLYNGIDYPYSKPTGRFSNGLNTADFLARLLGNYKRSPPPFLSLVKRQWSFKSNILSGVNFASGGSGILDQTGHELFGRVIPLGEQIQQFATVRQSITGVFSDQTARADNFLANSLFIISAGSNDFFDFQRHPNSTALEFLANLNTAYANHLKNLYSLGGRKFGIISVPPIGCTPAERVYGDGGCVGYMNEFAQAFYTSIQALLQKFSSEYRVIYSLGNSYQMTMNIINNSIASGFKDVQTACCGNGTLNAEDWCTPKAKLCSNRRDYLFWDRFHPTQTASKLQALTLVYGEGPEFVTPINLNELAQSVVR